MSFLIVTTIKATLHFKKGKIKYFDQYALEPVQFIEDTYITYLYIPMTIADAGNSNKSTDFNSNI